MWMIMKNSTYNSKKMTLNSLFFENFYFHKSYSEKFSLKSYGIKKQLTHASKFGEHMVKFKQRLESRNFSRFTGFILLKIY